MFLSMNSFFHKIKLKDTYICTFCRSETETNEHILWDCEIVQALLDDFVTFCSNKIHRMILFANTNFKLGSCVNKKKRRHSQKSHYPANRISYLKYELFEE